MKQCLLVFAAALTLAVAVPASAQYMWLDASSPKDGLCGTSNNGDVLSPSTTSVDVWLSTNLNKNGTTPVCTAEPGDPFTINSYTFILSAPTGGVTYGAWTDNMGFTIAAGGAQAGNDFWVAKASATILPPGTYKLGSLAVTVTGSPSLQILSSTSIDAVAQTSFGSACIGQDFNNTLRYGSNQDGVPPGDWNDICGTASGIPVTETTWGKIKAIYNSGN